MVALAATLLLAITAPLYTDEVGFKIVVSRVLAEGGALVSLLPQCASTHAFPVPASLFPAAVVYSLAFRPLGLLGLKLSGVGIAFAWFGLAWYVLGRLGKGPARARRFVIFCAAHALGLVPFLLVMARAEGVLLLCLLGFACFAIAGWVTARSSAWRASALLAVFALLVSLFFFSHPKALLSTPVVILAAWLGFERRGRGWAALGVLWVMLTAAQAFGQAERSARCPEVPFIENTFALFVMSPWLARSDPGGFVRLGVENIEQSTSAISRDTTLAPIFPSGWLPPLEPPGAKLGTGVEAANLVTHYGLRALQLAAFVLAAAGLVATRRGSGRMRRVAWFAATLLACLGGHLFFTKFWPFYNTAFAVPQLALVTILGGTAVAGNVRGLRRLAVPGTALVAGLALFGSLTTLAHLGPRLLERASSAHIGTLLPNQPASVPPLHYGRERTAIRDLAARCGIQGDGATRLVIDDATLFAFEDLHRPVHLVYVSDATMWGVYMPGEKNVAFLRDLHGSGIISRCSFLPTALASKMTRDDHGYCCLGPDALQSAP